MTDETTKPEDEPYELTPEEKLREEARESIKTPAKPIPSAQGLPDDVRTQPIEDAP